MRQKSIIFCIILLLLTCTQSIAATKKETKIFKVDTPLKALALYFPPPSVTRCLNHGDIPRKLRKAYIYRNINIPGSSPIEQKALIGADALRVSGKRFLFNAHEMRNGSMYPLKINWEQAFGLGKNGELKSINFFGLEDIIGLQKKTKIKDKIANHELKYETFLKTTKGKVDDLNYILELNGQDRGVDGKIRYFLNGKGKLGKDEIIVSGVELDKDLYELNEKYGDIRIVTSIKVYD